MFTLPKGTRHRFAVSGGMTNTAGLVYTWLSYKTDIFRIRFCCTSTELC